MTAKHSNNRRNSSHSEGFQSNRSHSGKRSYTKGTSSHGTKNFSRRKGASSDHAHAPTRVDERRGNKPHDGKREGHSARDGETKRYSWTPTKGYSKSKKDNREGQASRRESGKPYDGSQRNFKSPEKREGHESRHREGRRNPKKDVVRHEHKTRPHTGKPHSDHRQPKLSPARIAACAVGREVRERDAFASEVIGGVLARMEGISQEDSAFATKLARGVVATVGTLDEFINRNLNSPDDIQPDVRDALRVSAYELLFLDKAAYAAVDQGVELVCSVAPKAGGLANAVLRKMAKSAKLFPFGRPTLSLSVLARSHAFPLWLAKRLMNEMGLDKATAFMRACNTEAPLHIAVNALKARDEDVIEIFDQVGSLLIPAEDTPGCYLVGNARALVKPEVRTLFERGEVLVSDASAQAVAALACPNHDVDAFLEIGSGRGTKTILVQSNAVRSFGCAIPMVAVDVHGFKVEILSKRVQAYGIETVRPVKADGRKLSQLMPEASFDAVLLDAPCSGVGTLRRHPEIRWRLTEAQIGEMAATELDLLIEAAKMVKNTGALTYATCTVFKEENEQVVERFLKTKLGESFAVEEKIAPALTERGPDAHFAVRFRRIR